MTEISYIILSIMVFIIMIIVQALVSVKHHGIIPLAGARDDLRASTFILERTKRANQNMIEGLVLFMPLMLLAIQTGQTGDLTRLGGALFFWGRVAYAPLYWFGVPWLRTVAWAVSIMGTLIVLKSLLPLI